MESKERRYVGNGKKVADYDLINLSICMDSIPVDAIYEYKGKQYVRLVVAGLKQESYGNTHTIYVNDYKPEAKQENASNTVEDKDLPF